VDGIHDLGGRQGFGAVVVEPNEPPFHERWEALARALMYLVMTKTPNASSGMFRHAIERMDPAHYLNSSYYEHWLTAAATLAVESGLVTHEDLEARAGGGYPLSLPVRAEPVSDPAPGRSRVAGGDRVRVRQWHPLGHTRCPNYIRGKVGVVTRADGEFSIPDVEAHSTQRVPEATYSVRFAADELWNDGQPGVSVNVDLWDSYLEPEP
jgi:nitrile hydratase beta subunit